MSNNKPCSPSPSTPKAPTSPTHERGISQTPTYIIPTPPPKKKWPYQRSSSERRFFALLYRASDFFNQRQYAHCVSGHWCNTIAISSLWNIMPAAIPAKNISTILTSPSRMSPLQDTFRRKKFDPLVQARAWTGFSCSELLREKTQPLPFRSIWR